MSDNMGDTGEPPKISTAQELAEEIARLTQEKRHDEASQAAIRLLALRPTHRRALRAVTRNPDFVANALVGWRMIAREDPLDAEANRKIAQIELRNGNHKEAVRAADAALQVEPAEERALEIRLRALLAGGQMELAANAWHALFAVSSSRATQFLGRHALSGASSADQDAALLGAAYQVNALDGPLLSEWRRLKSVYLAEAYASESVGNIIDAAVHFLRLARLVPDEGEFQEARERIAEKLIARLKLNSTSAQVAGAAAAIVQLRPGDPATQLHVIHFFAKAGRWGDAALGWDDFFAAGGKRSADNLIAQVNAAARAGLYALGLARWREIETLGLPADVSTDQAKDLLVVLSQMRFNSALAIQDLVQASEIVFSVRGIVGDHDLQSMRTNLDKRLSAAIRGAGADGQLDLLRIRHRLNPDDGRTATIFGRALMRERHYEEAFKTWDALAQKMGGVEAWLQTARAARKLRNHEACREAARCVTVIEPDHSEAMKLLVDSEQALRSA